MREKAIHLMVAKKQRIREEGSRHMMHSLEANPSDLLSPSRPHLPIVC